MSIQVIKRAGHTNPANRRWPTLLVAQRARRQLVSYDPTAGDRLSELWGRRGAQWERPNKSCDKCVQVGINAGHVISVGPVRGAGVSATDHRSFLCARANEKEEQTCQASHSLPP